MNANDRLEIIRPDGQIFFYALNPEKGITNIGQHPDNDVVIESAHVGLFQAVVDHQRKPYRIIVLSDEGNARIEGQRLVPNNFSELRDWQTVELDGYTITLLEDQGNGSYQAAPRLMPAAWEAPSVLAAAPAPVLERTYTAPTAPVVIDTPPPEPEQPQVEPLHLPSETRYLSRPIDDHDEIVIAEMDEREITLNVDQPVTFELSIGNGGRLVAGFEVWVEGLDESWVNIYPSRINLTEGSRAKVAITVLPPRLPSSSAGPHHFAVLVGSSTYPGRSTRLGATVNINPYYAFTTAPLSPNRLGTSWFKRSGTTSFPIQNQGNSAAHFLVSGQDDENGCQFEFQVGEQKGLVKQAELMIPAGEMVNVPVRVTPLKRSLVRLRSRHYHYTVTTQCLDESSSARSYSGQISSRPLFGLLSILIAAALLLALAIFLLRPRVGTLSTDESVVVLGSPVVMRWENVPFITTDLIIEGFNEPVTRSQKLVEFIPSATGEKSYRLVGSNLISDMLPFVQSARSNYVQVSVVPPLPRITAFSVSSTEILADDSITVIWSVQYADDVTLTVGDVVYSLKPEEFIGEREFKLSSDAQVILTAKNSQGTDIRHETVNVYPPSIKIEVFKVTPSIISLGEEITVEWKVSGAGIEEITITPYPGKVEIDGLSAVHEGKRSFKPKENLEFVLTVKSRNEVKTEIVPIIVGPAKSAPTIDYFRVSPDELGANDNKVVTFAWSVSGEVDSITITNPEGFNSGNLLQSSTLINSVRQGSLRHAVPATSVFILTASNGPMVATEVVEVKVAENKKEVEIEILRVFPSTSLKRGTEIIVAYRIRPLVDGVPVENPELYGLPEVSGKVVVTEGLEQCGSELPITTCTFKPQIGGSLTATYFGDDVYARRTTKYATNLDISGDLVSVKSITVNDSLNTYLGAVSRLKIVMTPLSPLSILPITGHITVVDVTSGAKTICENILLKPSGGALDAEGECDVIFTTSGAKKFGVLFGGDENRIYNDANLTPDMGITVLSADTLIEIISPVGGSFQVGESIVMRYWVRNSRNDDTGPVQGIVTLLTDDQASEVGVCGAFNSEGMGSCTLQFTRAGTGQRTVTISYTPSENYNDYKVGQSSTVFAVRNDPPLARADFFATDEDTVLTRSYPMGVLWNDADPEGQPLAAALVQQAQYYSVTLSANGSFNYDPLIPFNSLRHGELAQDLFTYRIFDGERESTPITVTLTITGVNDVPYPAANPLPVPDSIDVSIKTGLRWTGSDPDTGWTGNGTAAGDSLTYQIYVWQENSADPPELIGTTGELVFTPTVNLLPETAYLWRVDTSDGMAVREGPIWGFTTLPPPVAFEKTAPPIGEILTGNEVTLKWEPSFRATQYRYCLYPSGSDHLCASALAWNLLEATEAFVDGLSYNTEYFWQVQALNTDTVVTNADEGTWWSFHTLPPPAPFGKIQPQNPSAGLLQPILLEWQDSQYAASFEVCLDTFNNGTCDDRWRPVSEGTSLEVSDLNYETTYYWQVRAANAGPTRTAADAGLWWSLTTLIRPAPPAKSAPAHQSVHLVPPVLFSWSAVERADYYKLCVKPTAFSCIETEWITTTLTSAQVVDLNFSSTYYWQVKAVNPAGESLDPGSWWSFSTLFPPLGFNKTAPDNGTIDIVENVTLEWGTATRADRYEYCYDDTNDGQCSNWTSTGTQTSASLTGLAYSKTFYWQVRAFNAAGYTPANGGFWFFQTLHTPGPFDKLSPGDQVAGVSLLPALSWGTSSGALSYEYCYYPSTNPTYCSSDQNWVNVGGSTSFVPAQPLAHSTIYNWQVRAVNLAGKTPASGGFWTFTTLTPPGAFNKLSPLDGATTVPFTTTLSWEGSSSAAAYEYCMDTQPNTNACNSQANWISTGDQTSVEVSNLKSIQKYYWQVRASNEAGTTAASGGFWQFTTMRSASAFSKLDPADNTGNNPTQLTLSWNASTGGNNYEYCYDTSNNSQCDSSWTRVNNATQVTISGLSSSTVYYWQVRVLLANDSLEANDNQWWVFRTEGPPGAFGKTAPINLSPSQPLNLALSWGESDWATGYQYCYDTLNDNACNTAWLGVSETSVSLSSLQSGTTYYWQVRALAGSYFMDADGGAWWSFRTSGAPDPFNKIAPVDNASNQPQTLTLSWETSAWADRYEYCFDTTNDNQCSTGWNSLTGTSIQLSGLASGTTYYWQVRAFSGQFFVTANSGAWWKFRTVGQPDPFTKQSPANGSVDQPLNVNLTWTPSNWADRYEVCLQITPGPVCTGSWMAATEAGYSTSDLTVNTTYYWQVRAYAGNSARYADGESVWWSFTTEGPPGAFAKSAPANNSVDRPLNPQLAWTASTRAERYEYCLDTTEGATCDGNWVETTNAQVQLSGLTQNTTYYWQVRAYAGTYTTYADSESGWWAFTTEGPPGAFAKSAPANNSVDRPLNPQLSWTASPRATKYEYCIDTISGVTCDGSWVETTNTQVQLSGLTQNTIYYWQVRAYAGTYTTYADSESSWWTFTTEGPPGAFSKSAPVNGSSDRPLNPQLSWTASPRATKYEYCIDTTSGTTCTANWVETANTQVQLSGLTQETTYYWQVRAYSGTYTSYADGETTWWSFTTAGAPGAFSKIAPSNGSPDQATNPLLSWSASSNASQYTYCIDSTAGTDCDSSWVQVDGLEVQLSNLPYNTTYYWQVRAYLGTSRTEANGQDVWWSFTTAAESPPGSFSKLSVAPVPQSGDRLLYSLSWTPSQRAEYYEYCIESSLSRACESGWLAVEGTSVKVGGLAPGKTYYWQVRAVVGSFATEANQQSWWPLFVQPNPTSSGGKR